MAEKKSNPSVGSGILGKSEEKLGTYKESYGGGTPLGPGEKAPSKAWVEANRVMQPRDENGQFTYNSANKKPLKYGPSRGTTIPPFLKGVKLTYAVGNKSVVIGEDGKRYLAEVKMTADEIIDSYKEYIGEGEEGGFKNLMAEMKKKGGAYSKKEKEAVEKGYSGLFQGLDENFKKEYVSVDLSKYKKAKKSPFSKKEIKEEKKDTSDKKEFSSDELNAFKSNDMNSFVDLWDTNKDLKDTVKYAEDNGVKLSPVKVKDLLAGGKIKSWGDFRAVIEKYVDKKRGK